MPEPRKCPECGADLPAGGPCVMCALGGALQASDAPLAPAPHDTVKYTEPPAAADAASERPGDRIGRYKLLQKLGEGGMGAVWMAEQEEPVRRKVALKVIKLGMDTKAVIARFEAERQALALMDHPNIAKIYDAGVTGEPMAGSAGFQPAVSPISNRQTQNIPNALEKGEAPQAGSPAIQQTESLRYGVPAGRPYFVMELVRGIPVTDYCDKHALTSGQRLDLFTQVCHAVQHAHQKGIIHRDLKPSNVLVTSLDGVPVPKVIDFGIAKATSGQRLTDKTLFTAFEQFIGTPAYMSPEQAEMSALDVDTRSDIYSLGVLLYELLTGRPPFDPKRLYEAGFDEIRRIIREEEPPKPSTRLTEELVAAERGGGSPLTRPAGTLSPTGGEGRGEGEGTRTDSRRRLQQLKELIPLLRGDLDWIVMKALEKDRARRYETANALAADLQRHLHNEPVTASPPSRFYRFQKLVRRNKLAFTAGTAVAIALAIGLCALAILFLREKEASRTQTRLRQAAQAAEKSAVAQTERAEAASTESRMTLATSDFSQAVRLIEEGQRSDALAYLVRSLSANPTNDAALTQLAILLTSHSWSVPTLILKHDNSVSSVQFSPDGKYIVSVSRDGTVQVWDAQTRQPLTAPLRHDGPVRSARFSPDGKRIVTFVNGTSSSNYAAQVWDAQSGQPLTEPLKYNAPMTSVQFSLDGNRMLTVVFNSGSRNSAARYAARVWDVQTGRLLSEPLQHNHDGNMWSAHFSPDGKQIVTASGITARVWDAQSGQPLTEPLKHNAPVTSVQFSPDGKRIVTVANDNAARVWDAQSGQPLEEPLKHNDKVWSAQFNSDGTRVVTASSDRTARVWDAQTGRPLTEPLKHDGPVGLALFSPDGKRIVTRSSGGTARVWDAQSGRPLTEPLKQKSRVSSVQFSPDARQIFTASEDGAALVWEAQSGQPLTEPLKHNGAAFGAQFTPDGKRIVTISLRLSYPGSSSVAQVWDAQTGQPLTQAVDLDSFVRSAEFSPDEKRIVTAWGGGTERLRLVLTRRPVTNPPTKPLNGFIRLVTFSPDGKRVVTASDDGTARVWDAQTVQPLTAPLRHDGPVHSAQFSPDGKRIVTSASGGTARVWDAQSGRPLTEPLKHDGLVNSAQFSPDGKWVLTASGDTARVWEAESSQPLTAPLKHAGLVRSAQFSSDGKRIVTSAGIAARVWEAQTGQPLTEPLKHNDSVWSAQFSRDGKRIVTASYDTTAQVWDAQSGQPLTEPLKHNARVTAAQFSPDGRRIVTTSGDMARVWDMPSAAPRCPDWLLQLAEAISGQVLNKQGVLEETKLNRAEVIKQVRERLSRESDDDDRVIWGRWFLADPATRTISPYSKLTVPEYIENRITENTAESLAEAEELAFGNATLLERIAKLRAALAYAPAAPLPTAPAVPGVLRPARSNPPGQPGVPASPSRPGATTATPPTLSPTVSNAPPPRPIRADRSAVSPAAPPPPPPPAPTPSRR